VGSLYFINIYCIQTIQLDQVDRFIGLFCKFFNVRADQIDDIILGQNLVGDSTEFKCQTVFQCLRILLCIFHTDQGV